MAHQPTATVFTIGHPTHPIDKSLTMLRNNHIKQLVDIRTEPCSRHTPQYEQTVFQTSLPAAGVEYIYLKELGGLRPKVKDSVNIGWRSQSFRNYADNMQTPDFAKGLHDLIKMFDQKPTAIMCAEAVPWRSHRSLVGDALLVRGFDVQGIMGVTITKPQQLTQFAVVRGHKITYPASDKSNE